MTFTDNVDPGQPVKDADLLGSLTATAVLRGTSRRGELNGTLNLSYDYYTHNTRLNGARYSGLLASRFDLVEDMVDIAANTTATLQATGSQGAEAATERLIGNNQTQVLSSSLRPRFRTRIADFAETTLAYEFSSVVYDQPATETTAAPAPDSIANRADIQIQSGPQFELIGWSIGGNLEERRSVGTLPAPLLTPDRTSTKRSAQGSLEYNATPLVQFNVTGGVDDINEPTLTASQDGAFGTAGFDWRPSDRTSVRIDGGYRFRGPTMSADIRYRPREWLAVGVNVSESIETQQSLLARQLNGVVRDDTGNLADPVTGGIPDPNQNPFDISNQAFRQNRAVASISGQFQRTTYSVSGSFDRRQSDLSTSDSWSAVASIGRQLSPRSDLSITGQYSRVSQGVLVVQDTETVGGSLRLDYRLGPTVFASFAYTYLKRTSALINSQENAAVVSLARRF